MVPKKSLCNLHHARSDHQRANMEKALKSGECLFCEEHISKYHVSPIVRRGKYWLVTKNDYPYDGAKLHYIFIHRKHIDSILKLKPEALAELGNHAKWLCTKYRLKGGALLMRFGDSNYANTTITHLHAHLISGGKRAEGKEHITAAVGYKK